MCAVTRNQSHCDNHCTVTLHKGEPIIKIPSLISLLEWYIPRGKNTPSASHHTPATLFTTQSPHSPYKRIGRQTNGSFRVGSPTRTAGRRGRSKPANPASLGKTLEKRATRGMPGHRPGGSKLGYARARGLRQRLSRRYADHRRLMVSSSPWKEKCEISFRLISLLQSINMCHRFMH